ncbi:HD domain-containing phosphohydrolase [uncultured Desulfovibrio sp.]|uniref:HD domain-containing phosphohydrolase n=1 Tax=uncultured Desulfovibrio sp. TaxID=167968 RepID=UPI002615C818|nr:HD domain-containing phosphohydrolase [uncultured Desulfovibrio sp.]
MRKWSYRPFLPLLLALGVMLLVLYGLMLKLRDDARAQALAEARQQLAAHAAAGQSLTRFWLDTRRNAVQALIRQDNPRLLAARIKEAALPSLLIQTVAREAWQGEIRNLAGLADAQQLQQMRALAPLISQFQRRLAAFLIQQDLAGAALLDQNFTPLIQAGQECLPSLQRNLRQRHEQTPLTLMRILPIRLLDDSILLDIVYPLMDAEDASPDRKALGYLWITCDISFLLQDLQKAAGPDTRNILMRREGNSVQTVYWTTRPVMREGVWPSGLEKGELVGITLKDTDEEREIVAIGKPVPESDLFAVTTCDKAVLYQQNGGLHWQYLALAGALYLCLTVVLLLIFRWNLTREFRQEQQDIRRLYTRLSQQRFLLDTVISAMNSALVLIDSERRIAFANADFLRLVQHEGDIRNLPVHHLPGFLARSLELHVMGVLGSGQEMTDTEDIIIDGQLRHYYVHCLPYELGESELRSVIVVYRDDTERVEAQKRASAALQQCVKAFTHAVEGVDPYLRGHSGKMAELSLQLLAWLGKDDPDTVATLRIAASLSQLGMIRLPHNLLTKSGKLLPEERRQMERHVEYTAEAISGLDFGLPVQETILQMHERLDGSGYPRHLQGDAILPQARILAVANTFCALVRPRSYRTHFEVGAALAILREKPFKYDQEVVDALEAFLNSRQGEEFIKNMQQEPKQEA